MQITMQVAAWKGGESSSKAGTYGIRIGVANRDKYFSKNWKTVTLKLEGRAEPTEVKITSGFWNKCPELRSKSIGIWLNDKKLAPWPPFQPPRFTMEHLGGASFLVRRP